MAITDIPQPCSELVDFSGCKKATAVKRWKFDLHARNYIPDAESVTGATFTETGMTQVISGYDADGGWVIYSGGTVGSSYVVTASITTDAGETVVLTLTVTIE